jgi:hypothetical protein
VVDGAAAAMIDLRRWIGILVASLVTMGLAQGVVDAQEPDLPPGLRPPTSPVYADPSWYDLIALRWLDGSEPALEIELGAIDPAGQGAFGMRQPIIEVYVDDGSGGATDLLPGSGLRMPAGDGWRHALRLTGDGAWWWWVDADGGGVAPPRALPFEVEGRVVRVAWPLPVPEGARAYAISGVHDPFSVDGWRRFTDAPSPWAFAAEEPGPPVVDVLPGDAASWARVRATGTLQRASGHAGSGGPLAGWVWWLLMGLGMTLAVGGVVWRAWRPAASTPAAAGPLAGTATAEPGEAAPEPTMAAESGEAAAEPPGVAAEPRTPPAGAGGRGAPEARAGARLIADDEVAGAAREGVATPTGAAATNAAPADGRDQFSAEAAVGVAGSGPSTPVADTVDEGATPAAAATPATDPTAPSEVVVDDVAAETSERSIDAPSARSRSAKRS